MLLECGRSFGPITLAYETYGELSPAKDNAILILHALSGDAHAAGFNHPHERQPGWWDIMIGPGKAFDTQKYFVICSNVIGGCKGSTGPSSIDPQTGRPYALNFPLVTIHDMVNAQRALIDHLGIDQLLCAVGGSMGGMQVLQWVVSYPERVRLAIPIATTSKLSSQGIAFNEVGRQAIQSDPHWREGDYYGKSIPRRGLAIARMIGHITYLSEKSMHQKFGRKLQDKAEYGYDFRADFQVESYLRYKGDHFVEPLRREFLSLYFESHGLLRSRPAARKPGTGFCQSEGEVPGDFVLLGLAVSLVPVEGNRQRLPARGRGGHLHGDPNRLRARRFSAGVGTTDFADHQFPDPRTKGGS